MREKWRRKLDWMYEGKRRKRLRQTYSHDADGNPVVVLDDATRRRMRELMRQDFGCSVDTRPTRRKLSWLKAKLHVIEIRDWLHKR